MASKLIDPAQPPLPTAWYFPFQSEAGSQTSILISESLLGFSVAATWQYAGKPVRAEAPAATSRAEVTAICGEDNEARLSQDAASTGMAAAKSASAGTRNLLVR